MESVKPSSLPPGKSKLARTFAKVLNIRAATGVAAKKVVKDDRNKNDCETVKLHNKEALEAVIAKQFASISSIKAAYAHLQFAQSPYHSDAIQSADQLVVSEFKTLSELKQCYVKKHFDSSPETAMVMAEIQEQRSLIKTYEIMGKKLESQLKLKDSEITFLKEKLEAENTHNKVLDKMLHRSGPLYVLDNLYLSGLSATHFITVLHHAVKSIRSFSRLLFDQMKKCNWEIERAAKSIHPDVVYWKPEHTYFAFESFVCDKMFDCFNLPNFSIERKLESKDGKLFFEEFMRLKSIKPKEFLANFPQSTFGRFCCNKYMKVVHPKLELFLFGNLKQREVLNSGEFPATKFFSAFSEMAKRVWLLHSLGFSFEPEAKIFTIGKGDRFSEVYMESVADEAFMSAESYIGVAFTVVPGFQIGKTIIQSQVYISRFAGGRDDE